MCGGRRQREHIVQCRMAHTLLKLKFIHRHSVMRSLCENLLDFSTASISFISLKRRVEGNMKNQKTIDTALDVCLFLFIYLFYSYIFTLFLKNSQWFFL